MSKILDVRFDRTLRLNNVVGCKLENDDFQSFAKTVEIMENNIKIKGSVPVGPIIQYTKVGIDENGNLQMSVTLFRQATTYIIHVDAPFFTKPVIRVKDCLYVRFNDVETKLKIAYDKLNVTAYENDIELSGSSYTIFVDRSDDIIVADIFMEKKV